MAISKEKKLGLVDQYLELVDRSSALFLADYKGMSVKSMEGLRKEVRGANGALHVTKNTLLEIALKQSNRPVPSELLSGQLATGFALDEVPAMAKALVDFAEKEANLILKGAILGDEFLTVEQIESLAKLPSLDQLRAQLLGLIGGPAQNVVSALTNGVRQILNVMDAYAKSEDAPETA